jgi:hypothetical protein
MIEVLFDLISELLSDSDIFDITESVSYSVDSAPEIKFGSYPSEIDSSYHPIVDAQNNAYISRDDYIHGNNRYVPK